MQIPEIYNLFLKHPHIITDTRRPQKNSIFIALKGDKFNGNFFAKDALKAGCAYAITDELTDYINDRIILVDDCLLTLQELAIIHRKNLKVPIIGITGTNGKTTTKELIAKVLQMKLNVVSTIGNLNNHIGVPLTLLSMNSETEIGVIEMGANHIGEIKRLCEISQPDYGIITNIGKAHLEGFGSPEGVKIAKNELYQHVIGKGGKVFIHWDNEVLRSLISGMNAKLYKYGSTDDCDCIGGITSEAGNIRFGFYSRELKKKYEIDTKLYGAYNFENALCAVSVGLYFNVAVQDIISAVGSYVLQNNRSQIIKTEANFIIMDAYNSNPTSLKIAIDEFLKQGFDKKLFIIGDMFEMGSYSLREHSEILELLDSMSDIDYLLVGSEFNKLAQKKHLVFENVDELNDYLRKNQFSGRNILIKGSRGVQLEKCLEYL